MCFTISVLAGEVFMQLQLRACLVYGSSYLFEPRKSPVISLYLWKWLPSGEEKTHFYLEIVLCNSKVKNNVLAASDLGHTEKVRSEARLLLKIYKKFEGDEEILKKLPAHGRSSQCAFMWPEKVRADRLGIREGRLPEWLKYHQSVRIPEQEML
jgi:hypothetical protein